MRIPGIALIAALAMPAVVMAALAQSALTPVNESGQVVLTIENHVFSPAEIHVRATQKTQILVKNLDPTAEEFDSTSLKVEKVIAGKSEGVLRLRSLDPGSYPFTGEYHADTAKGVVIAE
ncbi:MAG: cupredoxin domain-containing protein [Hyphomicrobiales bacterium]